MAKLFSRFCVSIIVALLLINLMPLEIIAKNEIDEYYFKVNSNNKIALTFDDGPHPIYTHRILDILDKYNIKATFFIVGKNAGYYQQYLFHYKRMGEK